MTDLRATVRLLEVISERQESIRKAIAPDGSDSDAMVHSDALDIKEAVTELRRRGDTIVRGRDLELVRFPLVELEVVHLLDATAEPPTIFSGPPQLASVTYRRRPERELLAAKDVRLPPIGKYMTWALELAAFRACRHGEGCAFLLAVHPDEHGNHWLRMSSPPIDGCLESHEDGAYPPELAARFLDEFRLRQSGVTEHRRYTAITHELLLEVALVYRGGGSRPTKAVMDRWKVERATASRWVKLARGKGLLGPARERRSGEF